jgi:lysophospholipase L1-like esterase
MSTETSNSSSNRRRICKWLLFLASLIVTLGVAEIAVRLTDPAPHVLHHVNVAGYRLSANPVRKYEYTPGRFDVSTGGFDDHSNFMINRHGFRDDEFIPAKKPDTIRILALGDSVTAGNGIEDYKKTYPKLLERMLNQQSANRAFEVLNMGVGGYHTLQEIETLREVGLPLNPDLVLVGFVINDFDEAADGGVYNNLMRQIGSNEQQVLSNRLKSSSWRTWNILLGKSRLLFFAYYRAQALLANLRGPGFDYKRDVLKDRNPVESGFELLNRIRQERKFKVVIFIIPAFDWRDRQYRYTKIHDDVKKTAARYPDFIVVDLLAPFMAIAKDGERFTYDGLHPNEAGHLLLAEAMAPIIGKLAAGPAAIKTADTGK